MSSYTHPSIHSNYDVEDAFSSTNAPNYTLTSPDYSRDFFPPEDVSPPKDTETPVESPIPVYPSSSVGSSSLVRSTTPPPDYPFYESIFAELDNSLWIILQPLGSEPVPEEPDESDTYVAEINQALKTDEGLLLNLDILEEIREKAAIREAKSKSKMEKYYNAKVRSMAFRPGDFVYRSNEASNAKESGKLSPKWEGPYEVVETLGKGAYKLRNGSGDILPRTWNVKDLKKCYL
ncbi:hypothetical protein Tco_1218866 [Tanacetum coccineum]